MTDITERRQHEETLRESDARYRLLFDHADVLISVYDREGVCQLMNRKVAGLFGGGPEAFIGKSIVESEEGKGTIFRIRLPLTSGVGVKRYETG